MDRYAPCTVIPAVTVVSGSRHSAEVDPVHAAEIIVCVVMPEERAKDISLLFPAFKLIIRRVGAAGRLPEFSLPVFVSFVKSRKPF